MALDMNQAIAQYGTLGALANVIPDLRAKLEQGASEEWTPDRFFAEVQQTGWWTSTSEARRQAAIIQATDPATWRETFERTRMSIADMAEEMGVDLGAHLDAFVNHKLIVGLDDTTLRNWIGNHRPHGTGGSFTGAAAGLDAQLRSTYSNMGLGATDEFRRTAVQRILAGHDSIATYENHAMQQGKAKYGHLAEQFDQGLTVKDIASPYIAQMAQTLEVAETDVDLNDQHIQRALMDRDDKGRARTQPLWAFERTLKDDPRWDKTKNAANQTYDMLARIGQDWGFSA